MICGRGMLMSRLSVRYSPSRSIFLCHRLREYVVAFSVVLQLHRMALSFLSSHPIVYITRSTPPTFNTYFDSNTTQCSKDRKKTLPSWLDLIDEYYSCVESKSLSETVCFDESNNRRRNELLKVHCYPTSNKLVVLDDYMNCRLATNLVLFISNRPSKLFNFQ